MSRSLGCGTMGDEQTLATRAGGQALAGKPNAKLVPFITTQQRKGENVAIQCETRELLDVPLTSAHSSNQYPDIDNGHNQLLGVQLATNGQRYHFGGIGSRIVDPNSGSSLE